MRRIMDTYALYFINEGETYQYKNRAFYIEGVEFKGAVAFALYSYNTLIGLYEGYTNLYIFGYSRFSPTTSKQITQFINDLHNEHHYTINIEDLSKNVGIKELIRYNTQYYQVKSKLEEVL